MKSKLKKWLKYSPNKSDHVKTTRTAFEYTGRKGAAIFV